MTSVQPSHIDSPPSSEPAHDIAISIQNVTKRFGSHTVLEDITFDIPAGSTCNVLGPSGTGKSVLLKNIIGLLTPNKGQVLIEGDPMHGVPEKEMYRIRKKFGVLFQDGALFGSQNILENIEFPLREHTSKGDKEIRNIALEKAELVGMMDHLYKLPGEVSGGMRKRAGLARAMVMDPKILFFDEPDSGLDPVRVAHMDNLVNAMHDETHATFVTITHNIGSVKRTASHIGMLFRAGLVGFGTAKEMVYSDNPIIRQFLSQVPLGPIKMDEMSEEEPFDKEILNKKISQVEAEMFDWKRRTPADLAEYERQVMAEAAQRDGHGAGGNGFGGHDPHYAEQADRDAIRQGFPPPSHDTYEGEDWGPDAGPLPPVGDPAREREIAAQTQAMQAREAHQGQQHYDPHAQQGPQDFDPKRDTAQFPPVSDEDSRGVLGRFRRK